MIDLTGVISTSTRWSRATHLVYGSAVKRFVADMGGDLSGAAVERWRDGLLTRGLGATTVHKLVAAVRAVSKRYEQLGLGPDFARAAELPKLPDWAPRQPPNVSAVVAVIETCRKDPSPVGLRDLPIVLLQAQACGERRGEIETQVNGDLRGRVLAVHRKGGRTQQVALDDETLNALQSWLTWRSGGAREAMFVSLARTVEDQWERRGRLTGAGVARMLARRCRDARVRTIRPHDLRAFFISAMLESGAKPHTVMLAAGHKSLNTTSRYVGDITDNSEPAGVSVASFLRRR